MLSVRSRSFVVALQLAMLFGSLSLALPRTVQAAPIVAQTAPGADPSVRADAERLASEGVALYRRGDYRGALERFAQARPLFRQLDDSRAEGAALNFLGIFYGRLGNTALAQEHFQEALGISRQVGDLDAEGTALNNLGLHFENLGQLAEALSNYQQALGISRRLGDREGEGIILNNLAGLYERLGQVSTAREYYEQALDLRRQVGNRAGEGKVLNNLGLHYSQQGQYMRALDYYDQALEISRQLGNRAGEGTNLNNLAVVYESLGQYAKALEYYGEALSIQRQLGDRAGEASTIRNLGLLYKIMGQYPRALEYYERALAIARQLGDPLGEATTLNNLGSAYESLRQLPKAQEYYEQALHISRQIGDRDGEATTLNNLGPLYDNLGDYPAALERYSQSLTITRQLGNRSAEGAILNNLGTLFAHLGRHAEASDHYGQALRIRVDVGDRDGEALTLTNVGLLHETLGQYSIALEHYERAIAVAEDLRSGTRVEELKTGLAARWTTAYERAAVLLQRLNQPQRSFDLIERGRARTLLDQLGNARIDVSRVSESQFVEQEQSLRQQLAVLEANLRDERARPTSSQSQDRAQALADQVAARQREYEDLLVRLKLANPEYASLTTVDPLELAQVQALLDEHMTLLSYFVTAETTLAVIVTRDGFQSVELPVGQRELAEAIEEFRAFPSLIGGTPPSLKRLYGWLVAPVRAHLSTRLLGIVPHGPLHYLPFAALTDGERYLSDDFAMFSLPSASVLKFVQQKRKEGEPSVLAVARAQVEGLPLLGQVDREAESVAGLLGGTALSGVSATESAFKARASNYTILHLAAHGQLNDRSPLFSRIALGPDALDDGGLEVQEIYGLDLAKADLVVLSACQTQLGELSRGDDLVGLTRAFIYAGSPSVIASLWTVDDEATGVLMTSFYAHLKSGLGKAAALRQAQVDVRKQYPHPYFWAAFVLSGDPGPAPRSDWTILFLAGGGTAVTVILAGLVLAFRRRARGPRVGAIAEMEAASAALTQP